MVIPTRKLGITKNLATFVFIDHQAMNCVSARIEISALPAQTKSLQDPMMTLSNYRVSSGMDVKEFQAPDEWPRLRETFNVLIRSTAPS